MGLRLAALSIRRSGGVDVFLRDLVGNALALSDYLVGEILSNLSDDARSTVRSSSC